MRFPNASLAGDMGGCSCRYAEWCSLTVLALRYNYPLGKGDRLLFAVQTQRWEENSQRSGEGKGSTVLGLLHHLVESP